MVSTASVIVRVKWGIYKVCILFQFLLLPPQRASRAIGGMGCHGFACSRLLGAAGKWAGVLRAASLEQVRFPGDLVARCHISKAERAAHLAIVGCDAGLLHGVLQPVLDGDRLLAAAALFDELAFFALDERVVV